jgi:hypothetical protein
LIFTTEAYCCRVHLGKQESNLAGTGRRLLGQVKSFLYRSEAELLVEQDDVAGVDLRTPPLTASSRP